MPPRPAVLSPRTLVRFAPLLAYYVLFILVGRTFFDGFEGDETRYVEFATNLTHGYYSLPGDLNLWNGPGYPLLLVPFKLLDLPYLWWRLPNAVYLFGAVLYVYALLRRYIPERPAFWFAYLFGFYPPLLKESLFILTEPFAMLLMCGFVYHYCRAHQAGARVWLQRAGAAAFLAWLTLTKVFYGYVLLVLFAPFLVARVAKRRTALMTGAVVFGLALLACTPYLAYTYSLTGRLFYWSNAGSLSLYWMSTPYDDEYGEWHSGRFHGEEEVRDNHAAFFESLRGLDPLEQDDALKRRALRNIREHPTKFAQNWLANVGRLLFSYPFTYREQTLSTYLLMLPNMFLFVLAVVCIYPSLRVRERMPVEFKVLLLFAAVAFGGTSLLSAYERMFRPLVPIIGVWIAYTLVCVLRIEIRPDAAPRPSVSPPVEL